jgi:hypothetical protein
VPLGDLGREGRIVNSRGIPDYRVQEARSDLMELLSGPPLIGIVDVVVVYLKGPEEP